MRRTVVPWGRRDTEDATPGADRPNRTWNVQVCAAAGTAVTVGVFAAARGSGVWRSDSTGEDRFFSILAVLMLFTAAFGAAYWWPGRRRTRVRYVERAAGGVTEIGGRGLVFGLLVTMMACGTFLSLGAAVEILLGNSGVPAVAVGLALVAGGCLAFLVEVALGRIRAGSLILGPDGIRLRSWFVESYLPWISVRGVRTVDRGFPEIWIEGDESAAWARRRTTRLFRFEGLPPTPRIEVDSRKFAVDPTDLFHFLEDYVEDARRRRELGTPAAATRLLNGNPGDRNGDENAVSDGIE